jgi:hypothetical protein
MCLCDKKPTVTKKNIEITKVIKKVVPNTIQKKIAIQKKITIQNKKVTHNKKNIQSKKLAPKKTIAKSIK